MLQATCGHGRITWHLPGKDFGLWNHLRVIPYLDDIITLMKDSCEGSLRKSGISTETKSGLQVNAEESTICTDTIEYLWYLLMQEVIKPLPKNVQAILDLQNTINVGGVCMFLVFTVLYQPL